MKHARADYRRIQDPAHIIPEDEPVFLIRGQDTAGPTAVLCWANAAEKAGASPEIVESARQQAEEMVKWQDEHEVKVPDLRPNKFNVGDKVRIVKILDDFTSQDLIGKEGVIEEVEPLANGHFNYYVNGHYMHEEELEPVEE